VGHAAGQAADGFQLLRVLQLLAQLFALAWSRFCAVMSTSITNAPLNCPSSSMMGVLEARVSTSAPPRWRKRFSMTLASPRSRAATRCSKSGCLPETQMKQALADHLFGRVAEHLGHPRLTKLVVPCSSIDQMPSLVVSTMRR